VPGDRRGRWRRARKAALFVWGLAHVWIWTPSLLMTHDGCSPLRRSPGERTTLQVCRLAQGLRRQRRPRA